MPSLPGTNLFVGRKKYFSKNRIEAIYGPIGRVGETTYVLSVQPRHWPKTAGLIEKETSLEPKRVQVCQFKKFRLWELLPAAIMQLSL